MKSHLLINTSRWVCIAFIGALAVATTFPAQTLEPASGNAGQTPATDKAGQIKVAVRRITETQYRHTIADIFGPQIKINARFEPEKREDDLLAIGNAQLSLTSSGFEQYFALAGSIADQVLSEKQRAFAVACKPANPADADDGCDRLFIESYAKRLFRRPLTEPEI